MNPNKKVTDADVANVTDVTIGDAGIDSTDDSEKNSADSMPEKGEADAQSLAKQNKELQDKFDALNKKATDDLNKMKSTFQRQLNDEKALRDKMDAEYRERVRKMELDGLTDEERKQVEGKHLTEEFQREKERNNRLEQALQERNAMQQWTKFFTSDAGIPLSKLTIDQDSETLAQSGWNAIVEELASLRTALKKGAKEVPPEEADEENNEIPKPAKKTSGTPKNKSTWADLVKVYGSEEAVYQAFEHGENIEFPS